MFILDSSKKVKTTELSIDEVVARCNQLAQAGMHAELQRFASQELNKRFKNTELRRILADSLLYTGKRDMAILHYEAILRILPSDIDTKQILADIYLNSGQKKHAIRLYEELFSYDNANIIAIKALAGLYRGTSNPVKAIQMYKYYLEALDNPEDIIGIKHIIAGLFIDANDMENALKEYEDIFSMSPDNLEVLLILADLSYKMSDWKKCLEYYNKILQTAGDDIEVYEKIAQIYFNLSDWENALNTYQKLLDTYVDGSNSLLYQNKICEILIKKGETTHAISNLKELINQYPNEISFMFTLAQAYTSNGSYEQGIELYHQILEKLPMEQNGMITKYISNLICTWAQELFDNGNYNLAFEKFFDAIKLDDDNPEIYYRLGKCNFYIKNYQDAIAYFKQCITFAPQEYRYYFALGCAYEDSEAIKSARAAFQNALDINPLDIQSRNALAITLTKELEFAQAIDNFMQILKQTPDNPDTLYNVALGYEIIGERDKAIDYYKNALRVNPRHIEARNNISLLLGYEYTDDGSDNTMVDEPENPTRSDFQPSVENAEPEILNNEQEISTSQSEEADNFNETQADEFNLDDINDFDTGADGSKSMFS